MLKLFVKNKSTAVSCWTLSPLSTQVTSSNLDWSLNILYVKVHQLFSTFFLICFPHYVRRKAKLVFFSTTLCHSRDSNPRQWSCTDPGLELLLIVKPVGETPILSKMTKWIISPLNLQLLLDYLIVFSLAYCIWSDLGTEEQVPILAFHPGI